ncbi:MAG: collagen binding domain-containing protein [Vicinamibacterales bacterium]
MQAASSGSQTGSILGRVTDATTGQPISGAAVSLGLPGGRDPTPPRRPSLTTAEGWFAIPDVPSGQYIVRVQADGYVNGYYGKFRPDDLDGVLPVAPGQRVADAAVKMWKAAAIQGTVTSDDGHPIAGATLEVRDRRARGYGGILGIPVRTQTDDRGRYHVSGLGAGDYIVAVLFTPTTIPVTVLDAYRDAMSMRTEAGQALIARLRATRVPIPVRPSEVAGGFSYEVLGPDGPAPAPPSDGSKRVVYRTTFYRTADSVGRADLVHVSAGDEARGIDFRLSIRPGQRVSGVLNGPNGPVPYYGLRLVPPDEPPVQANEPIFLTLYENADAMTDAHGAFTFLGVPAGRYVIGTSPAGATPWVSADVTVADRDLTDLALSVHPGIRISGRVVFDGATAPPSAELIQQASIARLAHLVPTGYADPPGAVLAPDRSFVTPEYAPGRYLVLNQGIGPVWTLRSALLDGRDVSTVPLELTNGDVSNLVLTYTDRRTTLTGIVRLGPDVAAISTEVVVFPGDYRAWLQEGLPSHLPSRQTRVAHTTANGAFLFAGLAPGEYLVAALRAEDCAQLGAEFVARVAQVASHVSLRDGERTSVELDIVKPR